MTGVYVWAVLKWATAFENPTALTTFRSWKVNFVAFWVYIGATFLNIIFANNFSGNLFVMSGMSLVIYSAYIGIGLGAPLVGAGIFLSWRIKQIWITYDPERSLAFQPFDYFIWEDEEPEEDPEDNEKTQIDDNTGDNTGDDTKTEGSDTTTGETDNTNSSETTNTDNSSTENGNNDSSSTTTTGGTSSTGDSTSGGSSTGGSTSEGSSTGGSTTSGGSENSN
jgi:uncharacterized membrane protein YgcG